MTRVLAKLLILAALLLASSVQAQIGFAPSRFIERTKAKKVGADWKIQDATIRFQLLNNIVYKIEYIGSPKNTRLAAAVAVAMINDMSTADVFEASIRQEWASNIDLGMFRSPGRYYDVDVDWTSQRLHFVMMPREIRDLGQDRIIFGQSGVLMRVFSDFQCPGCKAFLKSTLPVLTQKLINTGQLRYSYRHFPLSYHPKAIPAAIAAECAMQQNKFWEFHLLLSETLNIAAHAKTLGFSKAFQTCLSDANTKQIVLDDLAIAQEQDLPATPSVLIGPFLVYDNDNLEAIKGFMKMAQALAK